MNPENGKIVEVNLRQSVIDALASAALELCDGTKVEIVKPKVVVRSTVSGVANIKTRITLPVGEPSAQKLWDKVYGVTPEQAELRRKSNDEAIARAVAAQKAKRR